MMVHAAATSRLFLGQVAPDPHTFGGLVLIRLYVEFPRYIAACAGGMLLRWTWSERILLPPVAFGVAFWVWGATYDMLTIEGWPGATLFVMLLGAILDPMIAMLGWMLADKVMNKRGALKGSRKGLSPG